MNRLRMTDGGFTAPPGGMAMILKLELTVISI